MNRVRTLSADALYRLVYAYCERTGLIRKLERSFKHSESKRFQQLVIQKSGLPVIDAVHCLYDRPRTRLFLREIEASVQAGSIVAEAGIGTGILALAAARKAKEVYGIEINPPTLRLAEHVRNDLVEKGMLGTVPQYMQGDATTVQLPKKVDVIISENLYTGMFFEKQVQIMGHLQPYLKRGGKVIPSGFNSFAVLTETVLPRGARHKDLLVPSPERGISFVSSPLSKAQEFDRLDFRKKLGKGVRATIHLPITKNGTVNSLTIYSEVVMPSGRMIGRKDTTFLNSDIILVIKPAVSVMRGDTIRVTLAYPYGSSPKHARIMLKKLS